GGGFRQSVKIHKKPRRRLRRELSLLNSCRR
ncbi:unnamed protein product, partial [Larinioides sclopetarius]